MLYESSSLFFISTHVFDAMNQYTVNYYRSLNYTREYLNFTSIFYLLFRAYNKYFICYI